MKKIIFYLLPLLCLLASCNATNTSVLSNTSGMSNTSSISEEQSVFIQGDIPPGTTYKVGDKMYDYTAIDLKGNSHTFSKILKEKELLILNFFFTTCGPCQVEFPYLQQVYDEVKDQVEVLAVDPTGESLETVTNFINSKGYTFPVTCENKTYLLRSAFAVDKKGYPTSVVIDKNGIIIDIHTGTLNSYSLMHEFITEHLSK